MKATPEKLIKILDLFCSCAVIRRVCAMAGIGESTYFEWWSRSRKDDPAFEVEFLGVKQQCAEALKVSRDIFLAHTEATFIERSRYGTREKIFHQGGPSWQLDHKFEFWTNDEMTNLGFDLEERFLHDAEGNRLQHFIEHAPPVAATLATLAAHSKKWQAKTDLTVSGKVALGVSVIGARKPTPAIAAPELQRVEHVVEHMVEQPVEQQIEQPEAVNMLTPEQEAIRDRLLKTSRLPEGVKQPDGVVKVFAGEAVTGDPVESVGSVAVDAAPVPSTREGAATYTPPPDIEVHPAVMEVKRLKAKNLAARSAVERQLFAALNIADKVARERRLRELTGSNLTADDRAEKIGPGACPSGGPQRMV
jgi:hypothetical protein